MVSNVFADIDNFNPNYKGYKYRQIKDFKKLSSFSSVTEFETYYGKYIQDCLDNTYGGTLGIPCMIESDIWDRELNISYQELYQSLDKEGKKDLKQAQRLWIQIRDLNLKLVLKNLSQEEGTMYRLINAGDIDKSIATFTKQRTMFFRMYL